MNWDSGFVMIFFLWGLPLIFFCIILTEKFKTRSYWVGGILLFFLCAIYFDPPKEKTYLDGENSFAPVEVITDKDEIPTIKENKPSFYTGSSNIEKSEGDIEKKYDENNTYSNYRPTYSTRSYNVEKVRIGAVCNDGTTSQATGSGACSHHGGVAYWIYE